MPLRLSDFDAVTFDVFGTLIDWEPAIIAFLRRWADGHDRSAPSDAELLMAFDRARAAFQTERPAHLYPDILRRCFDHIAAEFGIPADTATRDAFAASPHAWPAYADSHVGLATLQRHAKIGALSNIDDASLQSACRHLDIRFDILVTAERVGAYKPDWPHFHTAIADLEALGIPRGRILHVGQSLRADITPANRLGLTCAWINRPGRALGLSGEGAAQARPDLTASSVAALVAMLTGEQAIA
ncbi:HAD-IA family hydrolase [Plastoroseomonas hellenica]|uniref:HAD-IA family hydrolase n=1 Tax=Plastoroseomonas hellenica TaxID=2687306 RepID=UPI001BA493D0|nr:HAD-IA family hydrolase [Plastoroseomonas hellenica]MBR0641522.1 HAD-IA family hydrolase [Plastoroseomonas hellenica]